MTKTTAVRARIEPDLKERAEVILGRHGLSHSTFITMAYNAVVNQGTVPLTFHEPNDALAADIRESRRAFAAGEVKSHSSVQEMFDDILAESDTTETCDQ